MSDNPSFGRRKSSNWQHAAPRQWQPARPRRQWTHRVERSGPLGYLGIYALVALAAAGWFYSDQWFPGAARMVPIEVTELAGRTIEYVTGPNSRETVTVNAPRIANARVSVLDGDTVRVDGQTYRLVGFNTPETGRQAQCAEENALGRAATRRLQELVAAGGISFEPVPCACLPGTEGTRACNYGRLCASVRADGRDVGRILIAEGLAHQYQCGPRGCPRRQSWCG